MAALTHKVRRRAAGGCAISGVALLCACGPSVATPMPEPPSLDGGRIALAPGVVPLSEPHPVAIEGAPGAATPGALVRALDLDDTGPAVTAQAGADGAFTLTLYASDGDELRLQAVSAGVRSEPVDLLHPDGGSLTPSPRHACVALAPGLELPFSAELVELRIENQCSESITLDNPRLRLDNGEFELATALPLSVPAGGEATLAVRRLLAPPPAREDVLFVDVDLGGLVIRYPIGLFSPSE
jgi:hypothetical protein